MIPIDPSRSEIVTVPGVVIENHCNLGTSGAAVPRSLLPPRHIEPNFSQIAAKLGTESRGPRGAEAWMFHHNSHMSQSQSHVTYWMDLCVVSTKGGFNFLVFNTILPVSADSRFTALLVGPTKTSKGPKPPPSWRWRMLPCLQLADVARAGLQTFRDPF